MTLKELFPPCRVPGCQEPAMAKGLCNAHYKRARSSRGIRPQTPIGRRGRPQRWLCTCPEPVIGTWNECQVCYRKPARLLGVLEQA